MDRTLTSNNNNNNNKNNRGKRLANKYNLRAFTKTLKYKINKPRYNIYFCYNPDTFFYTHQRFSWLDNIFTCNHATLTGEYEFKGEGLKKQSGAGPGQAQP